MCAKNLKCYKFIQWGFTVVSFGVTQGPNIGSARTASDPLIPTLRPFPGVWLSTS